MRREIKTVNKNRKPSFANAALTIMLFTAVALAVVSCTKDSTESKPADVDYYTCTMHPSVHSEVPGKCPICGMGLVPVKKKGAMMPATSGTNLEANQPTEFTVPVERQQQIGVTFGKVEIRSFRHEIRAVGTVAQDKQRQWNYVTRVDGYVQKLNVFSPGEVVEKGAPLLTIYSPELYSAQKEFVNALTMRDNARAKNSTDVLGSAEQLVESGAERLRLWDISAEQIAELEKTRKPQETLTLSSPFKGVVRELAVDQGRRVAVGDRLVDVTDLNVVWVWAQFYQDDLPMLKKDLPVTITMSSYPGEKFNGKIVVIDPFMNNTLRTARVRIDVDNPDFKLRPDMYVDVELSMDMGKVLAVPAGAILPTGLHNIAFVDKGGGGLEPRFVELGSEYGDFYEVKSGLKENERVVTSANFLIDAEAKIQGALKEW
jgi:membrane fusion protein, copper/silver efflux system